MRTTDRIYELVLAAAEPMTLKEIQDQLEITAGIVSGSLASLCRSGRLLRERKERNGSNGPKMRWVYWVKKSEE